MIQEAWIGGVSTRRVDDPVQAMGLTGISKSAVSKLCRDIDERVSAFLERRIDGEWPYRNSGGWLAVSPAPHQPRRSTMPSSSRRPLENDAAPSEPAAT